MKHFSSTEKKKGRKEGKKRERKEEGGEERKEAKKECKCVFRLKKTISTSPPTHRSRLLQSTMF